MPQEENSARDSIPFEDRLSRVVAEYFEALDSGQDPDREEILRRNPELAFELQRFFEGQDEIASLTRDSHRLSPNQFPGGPDGSFGDYRLLEEIGRGGMGVVFKAAQVSLDRVVALKLIRGGPLADAGEIRRFEREALAAARLDHPHIVPIYQVGEHSGQRFLAMKLLSGGSLAADCNRFIGNERAAAQLVETIARAVHFAHLRGVIHRDLKPANILLDAAGSPSVADFGLAKIRDEKASLTQSGAIAGTPSYMAPEQVSPRKARLTPAVDVYGLGAILYVLLSGHPPFRRDTSIETLNAILSEDPPPLRVQNPALARDLEAVCSKCLEKDPRRRYPTAAALADDLQRFLADQPVEARWVTTLERAWRWCRRNRLRAGVAAALASMLVVVSLVSLLAAWQARENRWFAYVSSTSQARALRASGRAGQRIDAWKALADAARFRPSLELRNEAIQSLLLVDLELVTQRDFASRGSQLRSVGLDASMERSAAGEEDGLVRVRRLADDRELCVLPGPRMPAEEIQFSRDGRFVSVTYFNDPGDWLLQVWDLEAPGKPVAGEKRAAIDFLRRKGQVLLARPGGKIAVLDLISGGEEASIEVAACRNWVSVDSIRVDPAGQVAALFGRPGNNRVVLADLRDGRTLQELRHSQILHGLAWHPDGVLLATSSTNGEIRLWDRATGKEEKLFKGHHGSVTDVEFSPDGRLLASTSWDGSLRLWDPAEGRQLVSANGTYRAHFSPDGRLLGSLTNSTRLWVWKVAGGEERWAFIDPRDRPPHRTRGTIISGRFSRDGSVLACAGAGGLCLWDAATGQALERLPAGEVWSPYFEDDPQSVLTWGERGLQRWRLRRGVPSSERGSAAGSWSEPRDPPPDNLRGPPESARRRPGLLGRAAFQLDGKRLLTVLDYSRGEAILEDIPSLVETRGPEGFADARAAKPLRGLRGVFNLDLSPDGRWAAGGTWKGDGVRIWDCESGAPAQYLALVGSAHVAFSPDGLILVTGSAREHKAWEVGTWRPRWAVPRENPGDLPGPLAFAGRNDILAVASSLEDIKLVRASTGEELATLPALTSQVIEWLAFAPGGRRLAAITNECVVQVWDLERIGARLQEIGLSW